MLADNPKLTVRHVSGQDPVRVVLDTNLRTPPQSLVVTQESTAPTWIFHAPDVDKNRVSALQRPSVELISVPRHVRGVDLQSVLAILGRRNVLRVLVEGGACIHSAFLALRLADRVQIFIAPRIVGDECALSFAMGLKTESIQKTIRLIRTQVTPCGSDWLLSGDFDTDG